MKSHVKTLIERGYGINVIGNVAHIVHPDGTLCEPVGHDAVFEAQGMSVVFRSGAWREAVGSNEVYLDGEPI